MRAGLAVCSNFKLMVYSCNPSQSSASSASGTDDEMLRGRIRGDFRPNIGLPAYAQDLNSKAYKQGEISKRRPTLHENGPGLRAGVDSFGLVTLRNEAGQTEIRHFAASFAAFTAPLS